MDVVNVEQVTSHHPPLILLVDLMNTTRLASQKRQVPAPLWHSNVFLPISEHKGVSHEW